MEKGQKMTKHDSKWDRNMTNVIPNKIKKKKNYSKDVEIPRGRTSWEKGMVNGIKSS